MATDLARNWRLKEQRYRLEGNVCRNCGTKFFPPRTVCSECRHTEFDAHQFQGEGELYSYTTLTQPPAGFEDQVPYSIGLIKLDEGPMVEAQLTDVNPEDLAVGLRMEMVTRKIREQGDAGLIIYGYKFRPKLNK
ncbi:MAG TPA: Zn-ribbon domain-containing OB-fold protein [Anaerolineae bacterium]